MENNYDNEMNRQTTKVLLYGKLKETRDEKYGIPLADVAEVIKGVFDEAEVKALVKELTN